MSKIKRFFSRVGKIALLLSLILFGCQSANAVQYKYFGENALFKGLIVSDWVPKIVFTVGTESSDNIAVTITITNTAGTTIAKPFLARFWLSDTAGGVPTSTAPDGSGTAANGWITSDGTDFETKTAEIDYLILSGSDGDITVTLNDNDADNDWYLCGELDGVVYYSAVINHAL